MTVSQSVASLEGQREGVFHIAADADLRAARESGEYRPESLASEGFIHCSTRRQVLDTAQRFFAGRTDLWLLQIDAVRLAEQLRYESPAPPSPELAGTLFPHLYGPLPLDAVLASARLEMDAAGRFAWPTALEGRESR